MRPIWMLTTAILFLASSFFSVRLLLQLADDAATGWVYSAVAVALALVQYAAMPVGLRRWALGYRASTLLYFTTWALLTAVSIAASAGALIGDTQQQQQSAKTNSTAYQLLIGQIEQLQSQAEAIQTTARIDADNGYRARALTTLDKLPAIQANIADLRLQLDTLPPTNTTAAMALFDRISQPLGLTSDQTMTAAYLLVAVLIELALSVSVMALAENPLPVAAKTPKSVPKSVRLKILDKYTVLKNNTRQALSKAFLPAELHPT